MHKILEKWMHKKNIYTNIENTSTSIINDPSISKSSSSNTSTTSGKIGISDTKKAIFNNVSFRKEELVKLYRGKFLHKLCNANTNLRIHSPPRQTKVIVFDLDETIGSFNEFVMLFLYLENGMCKDAKHWTLGKEQHILEGFATRTSTTDFSSSSYQNLFNELLDLYPSFLRYGILNVFQFLNEKKRTHECYKIYIYTNNKYSPDFPQKIQKYVDYKLGTRGFIDKIICAFKIGDKIIEPSRTTTDKTHADFIQCTMLPRHTEICFVDNTLYSDMRGNKIFYIQPKNYYHKMGWRNIVDVFLQSPIYSKYFHRNGEDMRNALYGLKEGEDIPRNEILYAKLAEDDVKVYKKLMYHVKEFFLLTTRREKTKKVKYNLGKFTRKRKVCKSTREYPA